MLGHLFMGAALLASEVTGCLAVVVVAAVLGFSDTVIWKKTNKQQNLSIPDNSLSDKPMLAAAKYADD